MRLQHNKLLLRLPAVPLLPQFGHGSPVDLGEKSTRRKDSLDRCEEGGGWPLRRQLGVGPRDLQEADLRLATHTFPHV